MPNRKGAENSIRTRLTLLLSCAGGVMVPAVLRELRRSALFEYRLLGIDAREHVPAERLLDQYYQVPLGSSRFFVSSLLRIVEQESVDIILPCSDEEALAIARILPELQTRRTRAILSPLSCLEILSDKLKTYRCLKDAGVRVPRFTVVKDADDLSRGLEEYGYPGRSVILKSCRGRGGRGLTVLCGNDNPPAWLGRGHREKRVEKILDTQSEFGALIDTQSIVMPCLRAPAYDADVLSLGNTNYLLIVRERTNPAGIPFEGNRIINNPAVKDYCIDVAKVLGLASLHDIDLMTDSEGLPVILEVNPRPSGSIAATLLAGFPLIDWAVQRAMGAEAAVFEPAFEIAVTTDACNVPPQEG